MLLEQSYSRLQLEEAKDATVVGFTNSRVLGDGPSEATAKQLFSLVDNEDRRNLVLDFSEVERLDSTFVAKLITLHKKVKAAGGRLALCHLSPELSETFKTLQLHRLLHIYDQKQEALQAFR